MDEEKVRKLKEIFAPECFIEPTAASKERPLYLEDKKRADREPKEYRVGRGETLESIANDIHGNKGNKYPDITDEFKKLKSGAESYEQAWQFLAKYNYGAIDPPVVNYLMCEKHGFVLSKDPSGEYSNLTSDNKNYRYKGGETLYYPVKKYVKTGVRKVYTKPDDTPGLILHPSFACPALVGADSMLTILVMGTPGKAIDPGKVNVHLKILPWDEDIGKIKYAMLKHGIYAGFSGPLFHSKTEAEKNIKCDKISLSEQIEDSHGRFFLTPEQKVLKTFKDYKYTDLYRVEIHLKYLPLQGNYLSEGYYNLFWINRGEEREDDIVQEKVRHYFGKKIFRTGAPSRIRFLTFYQAL